MFNNRDTTSFLDEVIGAPRCTCVVAYTADCLFNGYVRHAISERFLDVLNQGSIIDPQERHHDFLLLTDVKMFTLEGDEKDTAPFCFLSKKSTILVGEKKANGIELPPARTVRHSLLKQKKPVWVDIYLPNISVVGQIYISESQPMISAVDTDQIFLPVTKATLLSKCRPEKSEFEFVAINRHKIISIIKLEN